LLMIGFYKNHEIEKMNKAAALRISQLDLLYGRVKLIPKDIQDSSSAKGSGAPDDTVIDKRYRITFERNEKRPFAHPHYWSPFVIFGNWR
jgi:CHAT domain-containing protein